MQIQVEQPLTYPTNRPIINLQLTNNGNRFDVIPSVVYNILTEGAAAKSLVVVPLLLFEQSAHVIFKIGRERKSWQKRTPPI